MKILKIAIRNYRNLDGLAVFLDENCNFIVGENNLGKSNLLSLLNILFNGRGFQHDDFDNSTLPIEVELQFALTDIEIGHFQDLFDATDYSKINLIAKQPDPDEYLSFYHKESDTFINAATIRRLNYVYYDSLRNPTSEINFDKGRGVGRFLKKIISKYLADEGLEENEFLQEDKLTDLLSSLNLQIKKIKTFNDFGINAYQEQDIESLLSKIIVLKDNDGLGFSKAGYGVQFLILITLSILEKIQAIRDTRGDKGIFENEAGEKAISLVLGLDEPEIHLHPYMQRSLVKYLNSIIRNENSQLRELIKELFDIDKLIGQVIIVTHSPNILLNDYKQITRLFKSTSLTKSVSGNQLSLNAQQEKHLRMQFIFFKEAFFSRCVIFVEGESEISSFPQFAKTMSVDFDDLGISVIQAHGSAVAILMEIADLFKIQCVGISDKDDGHFTPTHANHKLTTARDFDAEILALLDTGNEAVLRQLVSDHHGGLNITAQKDSLNKYAHKRYQVQPTPYTANLKLADIATGNTAHLKAFYITWLCNEKGYPLGFLIGSKLTLTQIPTCYKTLITEAKTLSNA